MVGEARQTNTRILADALAMELEIAVDDAELLTGTEIIPTSQTTASCTATRSTSNPKLKAH